MKDNLWTSSHNVLYVMEHFVNFVALQMRVYYHTAYTPFYSFPLSLSASCNLNPVCTRAPPPRQLTFPLIHSEIPQGVNNCTVYSHYTASTGLIQLIKVVAVNQLTDLGPLSILLLILFIGMLAAVDCVVGTFSRSGKEGGAHCALSATFRQNSVCVLLKCLPAVSHCLFFLCGLLACWRCYGLDFINCLLQSIDKLSKDWTLLAKYELQAVFFLNFAHDVIQPRVVCHHSFVGTVVKSRFLLINFPSLTGQPNSAGESDNVDHHFLSPTAINPLAVHHFTSLIDL